MEEKKKVSAAQARATAKYEKNNYFKTLVRFPKDKEAIIREAAGNSLNGFIVSAVMEKIARNSSNIPDNIPNAATIAAFEEGDNLLTDKNTKRYHSSAELFNDLEN